MKKLISLVLILCMACMLIPAMAEDSVLGTWYLHELVQGETTVDPSIMGMTWSLEFKEDNTFVSSMSYGGDPEVNEGTWTQDGETISITVDGSTLNVVFSGDTITMDQGDGKGVFTREEPAAQTETTASNPIQAESEDAFFGSWTIGTVEAMGKRVHVDALSSLGLDLQITLNIEAGKATLAITMNGETKSFEAETSLVDGVLALTVAGEELTRLQLTDAGEILFVLPSSASVSVYLVPAT